VSLFFQDLTKSIAGKWFVWKIMHHSIPRGYTMPAPIPDLSRDQTCHHYQAPTGQRCGSPALKGEYYCYHHIVKQAARTNRRVLIDPEVTRMEVPPIEDRASIFVALAAVVHRLAENTIDTRRAGQMIYGLQVAMQSLPPVPVQPRQTRPSSEAPAANSTQPAVATQPATSNQQSTTSPSDEASAPPVTIPISKESLLYFLRSRHCASCNAELFPASELTERPNAGAPPDIIEEARPALPAPEPPPVILPTLNAVASDPDPGTSNLEPSTSNLAGCPIHDSPTVMGGEAPPQSTFPTGSPLPLSAVMLDNVVGCAWPDRTSFRKTIQDGQQGPKALCRGVSGGWAYKSSLPKQAACQPRWLATIGE
jgi:hypothetical protein